MTYGAFLLVWLVLPLTVLAVVAVRDSRRGLATRRLSGPFLTLMLVHVVVAVVYTTPWDNYLVATEVWGYPPERVWGIRLGWVPLEEYLFFMLQPMLTSMWLLFLDRRLPLSGPTRAWPLARRLLSVGLLGLTWLAVLVVLVFGPAGGRYAGLILVWALPPIGLQLAFGADLLWGSRRLVVLGITLPTVFLWLADTLAIGDGIWHISPAFTTGLLLPGGLPIEEALFFLVTNTLIVFGMTLGLARESRARFEAMRRSVRRPAGSEAADDGGARNAGSSLAGD
jgi:lycopene beta-cyclase